MTKNKLLLKDAFIETNASKGPFSKLFLYWRTEIKEMENKFVSVFFAPSASKLYWNENRVGHTDGQLAQGLSFFVANEKKRQRRGKVLKSGGGYP